MPAWGTTIQHVVWWVQLKKKSSGYPRPAFPRHQLVCFQLHRPPWPTLVFALLCDLPVLVAAEFETTVLALGHNVPPRATHPQLWGLLPLSPRLSNSLLLTHNLCNCSLFPLFYLHDIPMR